MWETETPIAVLAVEDNMGDLVLLKALLADRFQHYKLSHARNLATAKECLRLKQHVFDVILLDLSLPDGSGDALVQAVQEVADGIPIIILTGFNDVHFSVRAIGMGAADYLVKEDLSPDGLYKCIRYAIERHKTQIILAQSEKRFSDLFQYSPQPMLLFDPHSLCIIQANDAAATLYGYTGSTLTGVLFRDLFVCFEHCGAPVFRNPGVWNNEHAYKGKFAHRTAGGDTIQVELFARHIPLDGYTVCAVTVVDVTEKLRIEHLLAKTIIQTQEEERAEIGRELHDNVCQLLASAQILMGVLKTHVADAGTPYLQRSKQQVSDAIDELRNLSHRLAPALPGQTTLREAVAALVAGFHFAPRCRVAVQVCNTLDNGAVNADLKLNVYRILQEQLRNIYKHANATAVHISIHTAEGHLIMTVKDNGNGFEPAAVKKGIGLTNIKKRAELFQGMAKLEAARGQGCALEVHIPLKQMEPSQLS